MDYITKNGLENAMGDSPPPEKVEICKQWINEFVSKRKTINDKIGSYGLKHKVEKWARDTDKGTDYIPNGAFIKAAIDLGYEYKRIRNGYNAVFNMSFPRRGTDQYKIAFPDR